MLRRVCWTTHTPPRSLLLTISNPPTPTGTPTPSSAIATLKCGCASAPGAVIRIAGLGALDFASRQLADKTLVIPKVKTCQVPASSLMVHVESAIVEFEPIEATVDHPENASASAQDWSLPVTHNIDDPEDHEHTLHTDENIPEEERVARVAGTCLRSVSSVLDFTCQFADMTLLMPEETVYDIQVRSCPSPPCRLHQQHEHPRQERPTQLAPKAAIQHQQQRQWIIIFTDLLPTPTICPTNLLVSPQARTPHLSPPTHFIPPLLGFTITPSPHSFQPNTTPLFGTYPSFDSLTLSTPAVPIPALVFESPVPTDYFSGLGLTAPYDPYSQLLPLDMGGFTLTQGDPAAGVTGQNVTEFDFFASLMHNSTTTTATTTAGSVEPPPETPTPQITMFEQISTTFVEDVLAEHPTGSTTTIPPGLTILFFLEHIPFLEHGRRSRKHVCMTMSQLRSLIIASQNANRVLAAPPLTCTCTHHLPPPTPATPVVVVGPKRHRPAKLFICPHQGLHALLHPAGEEVRVRRRCVLQGVLQVVRPQRHAAKSHGVAAEPKGSCRAAAGGCGPRAAGCGGEGGRWRWFLGNGKVKVELGKEEEEEDGEEQSRSDWAGDE
ncbi:hypothetical protein BJ742DRAFT_779164 [Cladochytrium replicatum]|nr:hypothetical protein BJ742DRAFT_779164 [Cladochytrium replicatum]